MKITPGGQARLVVVAAILNWASPVGVGNVSTPPTWTCWASASCLETAIQPPSRKRASAVAALPCRISLASTCLLAPGGRAMIHTRLEPSARKPPWKVLTRATAGTLAIRAAAWPGENSSTAWLSPGFVTQISAAET